MTFQNFLLENLALDAIFGPFLKRLTKVEVIHLVIHDSSSFLLTMLHYFVFV